jgi:hypothetical protein
MGERGGAPVRRSSMRAIVALGLLAACDPVLEEAGADSLSPAPAGVLRGTVLYVGPRPACTFRDGEPERLLGRAILTLFAFDNPPPPGGQATRALNLLAVPAAELFVGLSDCMPKQPSEEDLAFITRSASFVWPEVPLGDGTTADYQVRGFFDYDEDFIPFFSVRNQPTRGDVAGGAFVSAAARVRQMARIRFGAAADYPLGQVIGGVVVTLAAPVNTERPLFEVGATTTSLSAEATVPAVADSVQLLTEMWELSRMTLDLVTDRDAGYAAALAEAGVELGFDDLAYAWYVESVDADADGEPDLHPVLGTSGVAWETPVVLLKRARSDVEVAAGVPEVLIVATVDPVQTAVTKVLHPSVRVIVPPIATVDLDPSRSGCRVPFVPPGNGAALYAGVTECQELPTGRYDIHVLHGVAGGLEERDAADLAVSQTGHAISGGTFSSQAWAIPNELGVDLGANTRIAAQGPTARVAVVEPNSDNGVRHGCSSPSEPVPAPCCTAVEHLCGLPLCDVAADINGYAVRQHAGSESLSCLPFLLPESCCR